MYEIITKVNSILELTIWFDFGSPIDVKKWKKIC